MIAIVMTYFNRPTQLFKTLKTLKADVDFEVIVVDDSSDLPPIIPTDLSYKVTILKTENKTWINPEPALNLGLLHACNINADIIIIQNAECFHFGKVIDYAGTVTNDLYFSFACFSINKESTENESVILNEKGASFDGENAWYNHSKFRPVAYDFCSAITTNNIKKLNGFDERLSDGWGYGDNYFLERIKMVGVKVNIIDAPFVVHQWHYVNKSEDKTSYITKNKKLYFELLKEKNFKAVHLITKDL